MLAPQVNNMQGEQLRRLDTIAVRDVRNQEGPMAVADAVFKAVSSRSLADFALEVRARATTPPCRLLLEAGHP